MMVSNDRGPAPDSVSRGSAAPVRTGARVSVWVLSVALGFGPAAGPAAFAQSAPPARPAQAAGQSADTITLNFKDADIDSVVGAFGHLLNRTFVIDPRVRGKMTLETPKPVTREQAYRLLQSALRSQGFAVVDTGTLTKVVPEADAKLQPSPVTAGRTAAAGGDQIVTQIFRLNYESATNLVPVLRPLISPNNTIAAYANNNSLVITDYASSLQRIARIIATLDSPSTNEVEVIEVRHAVATDVAVAVARMLDDTARGGTGVQVDPGQRVVVMADPRINSVIVRAASPAKLNLAKSLVARLDQPSSQPGNINVVYLRNAEAVKLAQTLRGVLGDGTGGPGQTGPGAASGLSGTGLGTGASGLSTQPLSTTPLGASGTQPGGTAGTQAFGGTPGSTQQSSTAPVTVRAGGAIIAADPSTNSLIITAPEPIYRNLRAVIDKLDARRVQVFIESLIVEVGAERAAELGIQWQFLSGLDPTKTGTQVFGGTNLPARGTGANIIDVAVNPASMAQGLNLGVVRGTISVAGTEILNLGLLARALETNANANILATPNLLTLDNEEARIIIGQNVPFVTGQFTNTGTGGGAVNPFQTIERRDVGTTLRVKPQVSESGTVRLQIFQEVSSVQSVTLQSGIITNRRAIESNVLVDDGQIIVLGGLIEERIDGGNQKVPGLGDIPYLGQLFRYDNRKRVKTNLLVFLRPVVVRDADAAQGVTATRYDYIRAVRGESQLPQHWALPEFPPGQMPPMTPPPSSEPGAAAGPSYRRPPTSLSPDIEEAARRAAQGTPSMIRTAPNEVVVPLREGTQVAPAGAESAPAPAAPQPAPGLPPPVN